MKRLFVWLNQIIKKHKEIKRWKRIVTVLAAMITFVTTYALILPAITVERNNTEEVGGMYLKQEEDRNELLEENALEFTGVSIAADQENAVTYEYADEDITAVATFSTDEEIPEGAELVVNTLDPESEEYETLCSRAADLLDKEFIYDITTCAFYDFALICDDVDVTPETGLVDVQINYMNNTVRHVDDAVFAGRFGIKVEETDGFVALATDDQTQVNDELVSTNADESPVIELTDSIITTLSLKGNDLSRTDSVVGILAGNVDEEARAAAAETDAEIPDYNDIQEKSAPADSAETDGEEAALEVGTLKAAGSDYTVTLTYDATSEIPDGASLTVSEIAQDSKEYKTYLEETKRAMGLTEEETLPRFAARFFDIKIMVGDEEFTPKTGLSVEITYAEPLAENPETEVSAVHFADETAEAEVIDANASEVKDDGAATVEFMAESFSVYGVIYTVDFHFEVNGREFEFSIQGGETVSLKNVLGALHVVPGDDILSSDDVSEENAEDPSDSNADSPADSNEETVTPLYDDAEEFIANIESVMFTDAELLRVVKITENTTAAALKEKLGLVTELSAELTEEDLAEFDARELIAPDWALISLRPFDSEEKLTITMKDGEVITIIVTDLNENPFGLDGNSFKIVNNAAMTATYGANNNTYHQTLSSNGYAANGETWTFEYTGTGTGYLIKDSRGRYLLMDRTTGLTFTDRDTALEHPIVVENTVDQNGRRGYIFYDSAKEYCLTYGSLNNHNVFYLNTANPQNSACCMELRNPGDTSNPGLISTTDTRAEGIKINLFDYGTDTLDEEANAWTHRTSNLGNEWTYVRDGNNRVIGAIRNTYNTGINANHRLKFMSHGTSNYENVGSWQNPNYQRFNPTINTYTDNYASRTLGYGGGTGQGNEVYRALQGVVGPSLNTNGFPVLYDGSESLDYLFDTTTTNSSVKAVYEDLNYLFIKDEDGYYRYDSNLNYAHYNGDGGFDVYASTFNEEGTTNKEAVGFFPFNDYNSYYNCIHGGTAGDYNNNFKGYSPHNNNYSDKLGHYDHHFGMTVEASFVMTPDGKYLGKDIEFNFSGDDDLWVFVDDVLVLDIGGVHNPVTGKINFNSGEVIVRDGVHDTDPDQLVVNGSQAGPTTIQEAFSRVTGKEWDDSPYTRHTLKVFYLERGGMYSNLAIDFNLPVYKTVTVEKELEGLTEAQLERYDNEYFYYQVKINGQPYTGPYGVLTRPATDEEKANWVSEYSEETGEYIGGHWTDPDHPNTETINKFEELVKWHIAVENGIVRVKPGWYFTIEELGQNDTFSVAELYGYDSSYRFYDGQEDNTQTSDLMEPFFAPTAIYTYKDVEDQKHEEELPLTEVTVTSSETVGGPKLWRSATKPVQYSDWVYFTNTLTTAINVEKVWYDSNGNVVTDTSDSSKYIPISYKIYRIPYQLVDNPDYNPEYVPEDPDNPDHPEQVSPKNRVDYPVQEVRFGDELNSTSSIGFVSTMDGFTGTLSYDTDAEKSWKETVSSLPTVGWYLHENQTDRKRVLYEYYISEISNVDGYKHSIKGGLITNDDNEEEANEETEGETNNDTQGESNNDSQDDHEGEYKYTIKNEPVSPVDKFTQIDIQKEWLDANGIPEDGLNLHKDDFIQFEVLQKRYKAMTAIGEGDDKVNTVLYPITINLWDEGGTPASQGGEREVDTVVVYVPKGSKFQIKPLYDENDSSNPRHVVSVGGIEADPEIAYPEPTTHTENENAPSFTYYYPGTTFTIPNVDSAKEVTLWLYAGHDQWWYLYDNDDPTNYLNKNENNHPTPDYHVWTCQLYCDKKVIWDLEEVYDHIVTNHDAYSLEGENAPVTTYPKYEMRLFKEEDSEEYTTHIEPLLNAPGNGHADSEQLWKGSITDLPLYEFANSEDGGTYIYTYEIVEKTIGSDGVVVAPVHGTETTGGEPNPVLYNGETSQYLVKWEEQSDGTMKFTNKKKETTEVSASKAWVNPEGEPMVPPQNATVTFELYADGEATGKTVVLDGTTVQAQIEAQRAEQIAAINASEMTPEEKAEAITAARAEAEAALAAWTYGELTIAWKAEWKDLPKYKYVVKDETPEDPSGEPSGDTPDDTEAEPIKEPVEIVYTVKETVTYPGYVEVDPGENYVEVDPDTFSVTNGGTITNKQVKYSLKIVKVDANNTETGLSGAKFQLTRKLPGESGFTKFENDSFEVDSTNANKRTGPFTVSSTEGIILEGLIPGEYQIEEKTAPNGYIITLESFTFILNGDGTVTPSDTSSVLVVPLLKDNDNPAGLQIGNEPGAALPSTGGPGTRPFTILGLLLIAGAGLLLLRIRRTI